MAIISTLNVDGMDSTITTNIYQENKKLLDTMTYLNLDQMVLFSARKEYSLCLEDFLTLLRLYLSFNNTILTSSFSPNPRASYPFPQMQITQSYDEKQMAWSCVCDGYCVFNFSAKYPLKTIEVTTREYDAKLSYPQWIYLMNELGYFQNVVLKTYGT